MTSSHDSPNGDAAFPRRTGIGVVGVILRDDQFLLIRRSKKVTAPGFVCFAGGGVEHGESEEEALVREMHEELNLVIEPQRRIWQSTNRWNTQLGWWLIEVDHDIKPRPNPAEVEEVIWHTRKEIAVRNDLLSSMPAFLNAWRSGELELPITW